MCRTKWTVFIVGMILIIAAGCDSQEQKEKTVVEKETLTDDSKQSSEEIFLKKFQLKDDVAKIVGTVNDGTQLLYYGDAGVQTLDMQSGEQQLVYATEQNGFFMAELLSVSEDNFYLYVVEAPQEEIETDEEAVSAAVVGEQIHKVLCFDFGFEIREEYYLEEMFAEHFLNIDYQTVCMAPDGLQLYLYADAGLYSYDLKTGEVQKEYDFAEQMQSEISPFQMKVSTDGKKVAFVGCELGNDNYFLYGIINLEKADIVMKQTENAYGSTLHQQNNVIYITDEEIPFEKKASGVIHCMDLESEVFSDCTVDNLESTMAFLTPNEKYMATSFREEGEDGTFVGYYMSIYDFESGQQLLSENKRIAGVVMDLWACDDAIWEFVRTEEGSFVFETPIEEWK